MQTCDDIPSMVAALEDFVDVCRNQIGVPKSTLICAVDSFSKLMSPIEAMGRSFYEGESTSKKNEFGAAKVNLDTLSLLISGVAYCLVG